eukprot:CAMPEP_0176275414 /NCGR_PEP_ID=MMETSP0121_2-20121125/47227_1 /TAXON_ID=160619 /ORGANISM="Kryptoperidinium foliaceum, Strain CCMP 1326" /LENGTH=182 /DNA_ID=CAMNT_0017615637 /DNA_START=72 /DNA_END=620 /DNA_ORIENTATION=+
MSSVGTQPLEEEEDDEDDEVIAKESVKVPYYDLLAQFSVPDQNLDENPAAMFQQQSSDKDKDNAMAGVGIIEKSPAELQIETAPVNPMPVPPLVAPQQKEYVPTGDGRGCDGRKCSAAFLGCTSLAVDCTRGHWRKCKQILNKKIKETGDETAKKLKEEYHRKLNKERKSIARAKKKNTTGS